MKILIYIGIAIVSLFIILVIGVGISMTYSEWKKKRAHQKKLILENKATQFCGQQKRGSLFDSETNRRHQAAKRIEKNLKNQFDKQSQNISSFKSNLKKSFSDTKKTSVNVTKNSDPELHSRLCGMFGLNRNELIWYCRRTTCWLGSDDFFIISERGFGYAPSSEFSGFIPFGEVREVNVYNSSFRLIMNDGDIIPLILDQTIYDLSDTDVFINIVNKFLKDYRADLDILCEALDEALDEMALDLAKSLINEVEKLSEELGAFYNARLRIAWASDNINKADNLQEANYYVIDLKKQAKGDKFVESLCHILEAQIMLERGDDHYEIKKIIDAIDGDEERYLRNQILKLRRMLTLD